MHLWKLYVKTLPSSPWTWPGELPKGVRKIADHTGAMLYFIQHKIERKRQMPYCCCTITYYSTNMAYQSCLRVLFLQKIL